MDDSETRQVLSTTEAGKLLSVSDESVKRYLAAGTLKGFRLPGGYYRVFLDSVTALMDKGITDENG